MALRRTVSKLLKTTYENLKTKSIGETFHDLWVAGETSDVVFCEGIVALEDAAKDVSGDRRMRLFTFEEIAKDKLADLFNTAISITENKGKTT